MTEEYVNPECISQELQCAVCCCPFRDPQSLPCGHTYCYRCVSRLNESGNVTCPVCKSKCPWEKVRKSDRALCAIVDSLLVRCSNLGEGCQHQMVRSDLQNHLEKYCDYTIVPCPSQGCKLQFRRLDVNSHLDSCSHRVVTCSACSKVMTYVKLQSHLPVCSSVNTTCPHCQLCCCSNADLVKHLSTCSQKKVFCPHSQLGCSAEMTLSEYPQHLKICPFQCMQVCVFFFIFIFLFKKKLKQRYQPITQQVFIRETNEKLTALQIENTERAQEVTSLKLALAMVC